MKHLCNTVLRETSLLFFMLSGDLSEDDSEEDEVAEETSRQKTGREEKEDADLQLNLEIDEEFKLPTDEQIEKENILSI